MQERTEFNAEPPSSAKVAIIFLPPPGWILGATCYKAMFTGVLCVFWVLHGVLQRCYTGAVGIFDFWFLSFDLVRCVGGAVSALARRDKLRGISVFVEIGRVGSR